MARIMRNLLCFVTIFISRFLFVAAITNVALRKPAFQSSTYTEVGLENSLFQASNAVDGNTNGNLILGGSCMHTSYGSGNFWEVDLGKVYIIDRVAVYNRLDCCGENTRNIQVLIGFDQNNYVLLGYLEGLLGSQHTFQMDAHTYGRWVRITRNNVSGTLHFCEVKVYGELLTRNENVRLELLPNKIGVGTVLSMSQGSTNVDCAVRCKTSNRCVGFNFDTSNLECTIFGTATTNDYVQNKLRFYRKG